MLNKRFTRRRFLQASAATGAAAALGGLSSAGRMVVAQEAPTGRFNWMTWTDHFYQEQRDEIEEAIGISARVTELADNADGFTRLREVGGQLDMISGDAQWNPRYFEEGLIDVLPIEEMDVAKHLYPIAREFEIWTKPEGYLGFPFGWSPVEIYYNPKFVDPAPDSWEVMLDPKYQGRVVTENQPVEVTAYMGKYTGAADPYNMTDDELAAAKAAMEVLKPNILQLTQQAQETWRLLSTEEAWIATANLGADEVVKDLTGVELEVMTPKEGTIGWMDAEMLVHDGANQDLIIPFLEMSNQPEYIAENFRRFGRPLFNEGAYKVLVDSGDQERADRFLFNKPETVLTMTLKAPGTSTQGAIEAFNEVFGGA